MRVPVLLLLGLLLTVPARADEGMWLTNAFPSQRVGERYGFAPDQAWLDHVRLSSVRLAAGCSGSFASADGLVVTNHHCSVGCIERLSSAGHDYVADGFYAATEADEKRCPGMEVNVLVGIDDVTDRVRAATAGKQGQAFGDARRAAFAELERACATSDDVRCDVVTLYHGGAYHLYRYQRYQDVRLVFAPEVAVAFYGGDPDNFMFPRYDLDVSFLRVYQDGKPLKPRHWLRWSATGASAGDLVFTSGHPGRTSRLNTVAQLALQRDVALPERLFWLLELQGWLDQFAVRGAEQARVSGTLRFGLSNGIKAMRGMRNALIDPSFFAGLQQREQQLRASVQATPDLQARFGDAWTRVEAAVGLARTLRTRYLALEGGWGLPSRLFDLARLLVRAGAELPRPNADRLDEFSDARLPGLRLDLMNPAPISAELEIERLTFGLTKLQQLLGPDDPLVRRVLGSEGPRGVATRVVTGTKLADPAVRKALFDGGAAAVAASDDPMLRLAADVDPEARAIRKRFEDDVLAELDRGTEAVAQARFAVAGTSDYPDATFTLRLSYGAVEGWSTGEIRVPPFTTLGGAFERHSGAAPFALPASWLKARDRLALDTPLNLCTSNDIVGGNSGSPVVDRRGELVGLIFDGNLPSLGGEYGFNPADNRAVAVDVRALVETLRVVYGASRVLKEVGR